MELDAILDNLSDEEQIELLELLEEEENYTQRNPEQQRISSLIPGHCQTF
ncbi:TPA: hypothetical protein ACQ741_000032 [Escherichia coli]